MTQNIAAPFTYSACPLSSHWSLCIISCYFFDILAPLCTKLFAPDFFLDPAVTAESCTDSIHSSVLDNCEHRDVPGTRKEHILWSLPHTMGLTLKQQNLHLSRRTIKPQLSVTSDRAMKENSLNSSKQPFLDYSKPARGAFVQLFTEVKQAKRLKENLTEMIIFSEDFFQNEVHFAVVCFYSVYSSTHMDGETCCKKSQTPGIYLSPCVKAYPSTTSAEFKITANRLTTAFLLLQMKNIRKLGEYSASQFVLTAQCYSQCLFDRTDILYQCEMGERVTFLFMVAYALVMISPGRCAYCSSPEPWRTNTSPRCQQFGCLIKHHQDSNEEQLLENLTVKSSRTLSTWN